MRILIRSIYKQGITPLRLQLIQDYVIPAWQAQTDKDFMLMIFCHKNTRAILEGLDWSGLAVQFVEAKDYELTGPRATKEYLTIPKEEICIRYDDDDFPAPSLVAFVRDMFTGLDKAMLTIHPTKYVLETGESYLSQTTWYSRNQPSNFVAVKGGVGVFEDKHNKMGDYFKDCPRYYINIKGLHNIIIHTENQLNKR